MDSVSRRSAKSAMRDDRVANYFVVPPDGGWGWVVVAAGFGCSLVSDGIMYTFGIFLTQLAKEFNESVGNVALTGSLQSLCYFLVGPFVSALLNRFGFRFVVCFGSTLAATGFFIGSFCETLGPFIFSVGILSGLGFGMIAIPTVIICGLYFEKWRALATGIATCGSGIGTLIIPPIISLLLERFSLRNTYRILAGVILSTSLLGMCYRPLQPLNAISDEKQIIKADKEDSIGSFDMDADEPKCKCSCKKHHNTNYPTTAALIPVETTILEEPDEDEMNYSYYTEYTKYTAYTQSRAQRNQRSCVECCDAFCKRIDTCMFYCFKSISRPMYRDDIFYTFNLKLLPQYTTSVEKYKSRKPRGLPGLGVPKTHSTRYHMEVTRVTTHREIYTDPYCCSCSVAILRPLATMLDIGLLKSPAFQMFAWSGAFINFGYMIPYLYITERAEAAGIKHNVAIWLLSTIGAANTVGRIVSGVLPTVTRLKVIVYSYWCIAVAGFMTMFSGLFMQTEFQFFYAFVYGMGGSCIVTLRPIIVVELFGLEHLTNAIGLQLLFMSVSGFLGTWTSGMMYDATHDFNAPFYISGGGLIFSAILLLFIKKVRTLEKARHWCEV